MVKLEFLYQLLDTAEIRENEMTIQKSTRSHAQFDISKTEKNNTIKADFGKKTTNK